MSSGKADLIDVVYAFDVNTYFKIVDHYDNERIFEGYVDDIISWLERTDNEFYIDFDRPLNYFKVQGSTVTVYPDYKVT